MTDAAAETAAPQSEIVGNECVDGSPRQADAKTEDAQTAKDCGEIEGIEMQLDSQVRKSGGQNAGDDDNQRA